MGTPEKPAIVLTDVEDELPEDDTCPRCGKGPEVRFASSGFGTPHPVCKCGHEWPGREFTS